MLLLLFRRSGLPRTVFEKKIKFKKESNYFFILTEITMLQSALPTHIWAIIFQYKFEYEWLQGLRWKIVTSDGSIHYPFYKPKYDVNIARHFQVMPTRGMVDHGGILVPGIESNCFIFSINIHHASS